MKEQLLLLKDEALNSLNATSELEEIDKVRIEYLGKKGKLTKILRGMGKLDPKERPVMGALANEVREEIEKTMEDKQRELEEIALERQMAEETLDVTFETDKLCFGHRHPLIQTQEALENLFIEMGFTVVDGPEIELVKYNFDALNTPATHPSRDKSDTFYFNDETVLRTHTSPMQIRAMLSMGAPLRIVSSGRVFRYDDVDDTHSPMFHQLEGLVVDKDISMANLIETLNMFVRELFGEDTKTRFRPHHFPFTEPSVEVDVTCFKCHGEGCPACNYTGWSMELLGAGMVHPNLLKTCGIDPEEYSGFAFGMGIDRITMVKYGIPNIRLLFDNDMRFLNQF